jgi:hypothetical protein
MNEFKCENCTLPITSAEKICQHCGYPQQGSESEKISYNTRLMKFKDLVEDSDKSVKGILSFSIIFVFMSFVVFIFSVLFNENHYQNAVTYLGCAVIYYVLYRTGKKASYIMVTVALLFYLGHTIFEFSSGMYMHSPVPLDKSFKETKGATLFFDLIPMAYMLFRFALMIVLGKYFLTELKLRRDVEMVDFIRSGQK